MAASPDTATLYGGGTACPRTSENGTCRATGVLLRCVLCTRGEKAEWYADRGLLSARARSTRGAPLVVVGGADAHCSAGLAGSATKAVLRLGAARARSVG